MSKAEFLTILQESLSGNIPQAEISENIRYYDQYFRESGRSEAEVCEELGDPRLIAKSVIEAYIASKGPMAGYYTEQARDEYAGRQNTQKTYGTENTYREYTTSFSEKKWYEKLLWILVAVAGICIVVVLAKVALNILVKVILPVVAVLLIIKLIADRVK